MPPAMRRPGADSRPAWKAAASGASAPVVDDAELVLHLDRRVGQVLQLAGGDDLADRAFRPRRLAARQGGHGAEAGVLQPLGLDVPVGQLLAERRVAERRARCRVCSSRASVMIADSPGRAPPPTASRSFISVTSETFQPSSTAPSRWLSFTRTSVK